MTLASGASGQGLVNFLNNPTTLISVNGVVLPSGQGGFYWFALLAAPVGTTDHHAFTFTGVYATNQNAAGRINGGFGLVVNNWAAGETKAFYVAGWSVNAGTVFNPAWIGPGNYHTPYGDFAGPSQGFFGVSAIAPLGVAGGGPDVIPNLIVFGGTQGLRSGFNLGVPEPTALVAGPWLGVAWLLWGRRRQASRGPEERQNNKQGSNEINMSDV